MTEILLCQNGVTIRVPHQLPALSLRYRDLLVLQDEPQTLAALWDDLAKDFDAIGYKHMGARCERMAADVMRSKRM